MSHLTYIVATVLLAAPSTQAAPSIDAAAVDALLTGYVEDQVYSGELLIALGDQVLLHRRYGFRDWSSRAPLPEGGIFKIGSVTKQFTAAAILRLESQGRLQTSDPLARHLPELPRALTGSDQAPVTIHHLVNHTSGLPDPIYANMWGAERGFDALLEALQTATLRHAPGAEFHYNNAGYALLGEIIRRASGSTYEQLLRRELFEPLGMRASGVKLDPAQRELQVPGHVSNVLSIVPSQQAFGRFITGDYDWDLLANGNVSSSVIDLHRWVRALQRDEIFAGEQRFRLLEPGLRDYAYGWIARQVDGLDEPLYWHNGAIIPFGFTADLGWTRGSELVVISLSNLDDTAVAQNVFDNVLRAITGAAVEAPQAGFEASGSYLTIQILALLLSTPLLALLIGAYLIWLLVLRPRRSRVQIYVDALGVVSLSIFVAVILQTWFGAVVVVFAVGLTVRAAWRGRELGLLHTAPWKQWSLAAGSVVSSGLVLLLAALIVSYF